MIQNYCIGRISKYFIADYYTVLVVLYTNILYRFGYDGVPYYPCTQGLEPCKSGPAGKYRYNINLKYLVY